ncbi:ABC transporter substrate-binding protein [Falsiroseomonas selenitidurans]|uniref:ABC transporter substrate-binding protein n=1 Tax=Falsiroseomonas selenitidurans TaxID=2716335 RepID=A0ABX1E747_9PROT|nr:ABC transporter substrate-binding protein [Falsiroseomonas selenitidurans]NKC32891.1 ABC transporter substrate-binding protein [Falsiroseomonas selenitidurans]
MTPLTLQEPFRAVFYTPFYAALARGDFARQGVEVRLITVGEPDRAVANLLSGAADLAWSGPMRVIRDHAADPASPLVSFGGVVMRDPFLLVGRGMRPGFKLPDLAALRLGVVSEVPTPWWCLQQDLLGLGLDPARLAVREGATMAANMAAMLAGEIDVAQLFEPFASQAVAAGGAIWHAQASRGPTSYTAFYATRALLADKRPAMLGMVRGLAAMQAWLHATPAEGVAAVVADHFPDLDRGVLATAIGRYLDLGIWARDPVFPQAAFEALEGAMAGVGAIPRRPGFAACVDTAVVAEALA